MEKVLVVDDEIEERIYMTTPLRKAGFEVVEADGVESAMAELRKGGLKTMVSDFSFEAKGNFPALARAMRKENIELPIVVASSADRRTEINTLKTEGALPETGVGFMKKVDIILEPEQFVSLVNSTASPSASDVLPPDKGREGRKI